MSKKKTSQISQNLLKNMNSKNIYLVIFLKAVFPNRSSVTLFKGSEGKTKIFKRVNQILISIEFYISAPKISIPNFDCYSYFYKGILELPFVFLLIFTVYEIAPFFTI